MSYPDWWLHPLVDRASESVAFGTNTSAISFIPSSGFHLIEEPHQAQLTWTHVAIGFSFILFDAGVATILRLGVGLSLVVAASRCIAQLSVVATILQQVFQSHNPWAVAAISFVLNFLGTFEIVVNKSPRRFQHMFPAVLVAMLCSTIPMSVIGAKFAMSVDPFWTPIQFIPTVGMLCGSTISGIVVAVTYILKEFQENRDKIEIYLSFGASRMEACRPIAIQALKLAITPPINGMSVLGIIAIPGMMTGAILGGSSVQQAARLQMIIMFMITASTTLAAVITTLVAITICVDNLHRVRSERITIRKSNFGFALGWVNGGAMKVMSSVGLCRRITSKGQKQTRLGREASGIRMGVVRRANKSERDELMV